MKNITTNVTLSEVQDRTLKIKAAEAGMSKRAFLAHITKGWIEEQGMKSRIHNILEQASKLPNREIYFTAVERLISASLELCEYRVKKEMAKDFGATPEVKNIEEVCQQINEELTVLRQITEIPDVDPDLLSYYIMEDYFQKRAR